MKPKIFNYLFLTIAIGFATIACTPEDGRDGIDGEQGPRGEDGTVNVMYSDWMPISWNTQNDPTFKVMSIEEPLITQEFIDSGGMVFMYLRLITPGPVVGVFPLPIILGNDYLWFYYLTTANFSGFQMIADSIDNITPVNNNYVGQEYSIRYVVIPGGISLGRNAQPDWEKVDKNNYEEVAAFLGIQD